MDGKSEYCHVEIASEKKQDDDYCLELYETYPCHICNTEVPQTCYKKHIKSKKHQIYKKLTGCFLENVTKQIIVDVDNMNPNNEEDTSYYCETCSKLVLAENQGKHDLSNYHLTSIENEKLIHNFFKMYIDGMNIDNNNIKKNLNEAVPKHCSSLNIDGSGDADGELEIKNYINNVSIPMDHSVHKTNEIHYTYEDAFPISSSITEELFDGKEMTNFESYLKEMMAKYELNFNIPCTENNFVVISTPKGYKQQVTIDTFHGYKKMNSFLFCQLCSKWVNEKTEKQQHNETEQHVRNIMRPVNDDFEREKIDFNGHITESSWSHCLLCNEMVPSGSNHAELNPNHTKNNLTNSLDSKQTAKLPDKTFCNICCITIDTHDFIAHTKDLKHVQKSKTMLSTNNILNISGLETNSVGHNKMTTNIITKGNETCVKIKKIFCYVCNMYIRSFIAHTKTEKHKHTKAAKHKQNLKQDLSKTSLLETKSDITHKKQILEETNSVRNFCPICQVPVPNGGMAVHMQGKAHKKKINVLKNL